MFVQDKYLQRLIIFCPQTRAQRLCSPLKVNNWCHTEFVQVQTLSETDTLFLYMYIVCLQKMLHILDLEILNHKKGKCFFYYQHKEIIFWLLVKMIFIYCKSMCWLYWRPGWEYSVQGSILHGGFNRCPTPHPFIYHFWQKRCPFYIPSSEKWTYPFHVPCLEHSCIPFNCCKFTILLNINKSLNQDIFLSPPRP